MQESNTRYQIDSNIIHNFFKIQTIRNKGQRFPLKGIQITFGSQYSINLDYRVRIDSSCLPLVLALRKDGTL